MSAKFSQSSIRDVKSRLRNWLDKVATSGGGSSRKGKPKDLLLIRKFVRRTYGSKLKTVNGQIFKKAANLWPYFLTSITLALVAARPVLALDPSGSGQMLLLLLQGITLHHHGGTSYDVPS